MQNSFIWRVEMLGKIRASRHETDVISRFPTQKTAILLAYLSYFAHRSHAREELIDLLWPEADLSAGRLRLRVALNALRRRLEPPDVLPTSVLQADAQFVTLRQGAVTTDVSEFIALSEPAEKNAPAAQQIANLTRAVGLYRGELLPGYYEDWILTARAHLAERLLGILHAVAAALEAQGDFGQASDYARRAICLDPLREESHLLLLRLLARSGDTHRACRQYEELAALLQSVGTAPSAPVHALLEQIRAGKLALPVSALILTSPPAPSTSVNPTSPSPALPSSPSADAERERISRLPAPLTRFYGRREEIEQIASCLIAPDTRLVTLTGIGGTGKTRLSLEIARSVSVSFSIVCFVSLAELTEVERLPEVITQTLRLPRLPETSSLEQIVALLETRSALLVLDNFEQLLPEGADSVYSLLERLPLLTLLATSRQALGLSGEHEFPVLPLCGPSDLDLGPAAALCYPDIALFLDRAQTAQPAFQITVRNVAATITLCRRLEGLPLAIELAASWVGTLTPAQMLSRLNRRFDLLISRRRDVPTRHQTLRAAIEWSYARMEPALRRFFTQLSVFRSGWTLEAAEIVCREPQASSYLRLLRTYALITSEVQEEGKEIAQTGRESEADSEPEDSLRYRMLETLQEFAREQLEEEEWRSLAERHARWCLATIKPESLILQELDNYRAALTWTEAEPEQNELYLQLVCALCLFWRVKGWWREGLTWIRTALQREERTYSHHFARLHYGAATMLWLLNDLEATVPHHQQALALYVEAGNQVGIMHILSSLGCVALSRHYPEDARQFFQEALSIAQQIQNDGMMVTLYGNLGCTAIVQKDWSAAEEYMQSSLTKSRQLHQSEAWPLQNLADLAYAQSHWNQARTLYEDSLAKYRLIGETYRIAEVLDRLSEVLQHCGEQEKADHCREESQLLSRQLRGA